jgi:hypothetical protein
MTTADAEANMASSKRQQPPMTPRPTHTVVLILKKNQPRATFARRKTYVADLISSGAAEYVFGPGKSRSSLGGTGIGELPTVVTAKAGSESDAREILDQSRADSLVETCYVAPPRMRFASRTKGVQAGSRAAPKDWALEAIRLNEARKQIDFSKIVPARISIIDSGVDEKHPALAAALGTYEIFNGTDRADSSGHGTHVAGIIGARSSVDYPVSGVCEPKVDVLKAIDPYDVAGYYRAISTATGRSKVINFSLGGPEDPVETLLVTRALEGGTVVVAAMGNDYEGGNEPNYPAAVPGVIAVGAVDSNLTRAIFSNTGAHIDLVAPGVGIASTVPTYKCLLAKRLGWDSWDGTSMATPFVAAAAAMILGMAPTLTPNDVGRAIKTRQCPNQTEFDEEFGRGILDVCATLSALQ